VLAGQTLAFAATARDQFGAAMPAGALTWTVSGGGSIDASGLFHAAATPGGPFRGRGRLTDGPDLGHGRRRCALFCPCSLGLAQPHFWHLHPALGAGVGHRGRGLAELCMGAGRGARSRGLLGLGNPRGQAGHGHLLQGGALLPRFHTLRPGGAPSVSAGGAFRRGRPVSVAAGDNAGGQRDGAARVAGVRPRGTVVQPLSSEGHPARTSRDAGACLPTASRSARGLWPGGRAGGGYPDRASRARSP
jgi:hypothetical protein